MHDRVRVAQYSPPHFRFCGRVPTRVQAPTARLSKSLHKSVSLAPTAFTDTSVLQEEEEVLISRPSMLAEEVVEVMTLEMNLASRFPTSPALQVHLPWHNCRAP